MQALPRTSSAKLIFLTLAAFACAVLPRAAQAQAAAEGWWLDQSGRAGIFIAPCGAALCGNIEWLKAPDPGTSPAKTDIHNPDASLQSRPLCGLSMLGGFVPDGSGGWTNGWIYDPEKGKTYKSNMHVAANGDLDLRGYIGIPMLGRTAVWARLPAAPPRCTAP